MIRWLRSLFAWRLVRDQVVWGYWENAVTGQRRAILQITAGQPLDFDWLRAGAGRPYVLGRNGKAWIDD
jgi:hypothetical protein